MPNCHRASTSCRQSSVTVNLNSSVAVSLSVQLTQAHQPVVIQNSHVRYKLVLRQRAKEVLTHRVAQNCLPGNR